MKKVLVRVARQSPALIVAMIALFVALTGTAVATTSALITGRQIQNNSITGLDVKNRSLTPRDFRGSVRGPRGLRGLPGAQGIQGIQGVQGPPGPLGAAGGDLSGAYPNPTIAAPEAAHIVGAVGEPAFQNGWAVFSAPLQGPVSFYKDRLGTVHVSGGAAHAGTSGCGSTLFTLPAGYRPATGLGFVVNRQDSAASHEVHRVNVDADGDVFLVFGCVNNNPTSILTLNASFPAAAGAAAAATKSTVVTSAERHVAAGIATE